MSKILFFGYGIYNNPERLRQILGKEPEGGEPAVIEGFNLAIQEIDSIPEKARGILKSVHSKSFRSYTLRKGQGLVQGRLWLLTEEDFEKIKEWNFIGQSDYSWRETIQAHAITSEGKRIPVLTEKILDSQKVEGFVNGLNYETELNADAERKREIEHLKELDKSHIIQETNRLREQLALV